MTKSLNKDNGLRISAESEAEIQAERLSLLIPAPGAPDEEPCCPECDTPEGAKHREDCTYELSTARSALVDAVGAFCECRVNDDDMLPSGSFGPIARMEMRRKSLQNKMEYAYATYRAHLDAQGETNV